MIKLRRVSKQYPPDQAALLNIDLTVEDGDFVFIAGASGAGKSTLLKILFGADQATSGQVLVGGRNLSTLSPDHVAVMRREIGFVFQDYKLLPRRTVIDNVAFGLEVLGYPVKERRHLAWMMLKSMGLGERAEASPLTLSGGEQQRVAIARSLIHRPRLILADEPTGNLDREMTRVIFDLLLEANAAGVTIVVATHDLAIIEELNLRTVVLDNGKVLGDFDQMRGLH